MNERNDNSWLHLDESDIDLTCNVNLQFALTPDDKKLWDTMDEAIFQTINAFAGNETDVDYWDKNKKEWIESRPDQKHRRCSFVVHESGLSRMGDKNVGCLDELYRPNGIHNVVS